MNERTSDHRPDRWRADRPKGSYALGASVAGVVGVLALSAFLGSGAGAAGSHTVDLLGAGQTVDVDLTDTTYAEVVTALEETDLTLAVPFEGFDGLDAMLDVPVDVVTDDTLQNVVLVMPEPDELPSLANGVLSGVDVQLMLTVDWDESLGVDSTPDVALGLKVADRTLSELYPPWASGPLPELPDDVVAFTDAVLTLTADGVSLDPASVVPEVTDFYGLDDATLLETGSGLLAELDLASLPAAQAVTEFLQIRPDEIPVVAGSLADTAALLFDGSAAVDPDQFALNGPFEVDSSQLEWLDRGNLSVPGLVLPEFRLRVGAAPERIPTVTVHDVVDVTTGGTTNRFDYEFSLQEGATLDITATADEFEVPFGLGWMGPFTAAELNLFARDDGGVGAAFEATVPVSPTPPRVRIAVADDPANLAGELSVVGDVALRDLVAWATRSGAGDPATAFPASDFDVVELDDVVLHDVALTFETSSARTMLSSFASASGIQAFDADLDVKALVAIEDTPTAEPTLLVALTIVDPDCDGGACIALHQALPLPDGDLAADLTVPAVNLAVIQPEGAGFDPTGLGEGATAFLEQVLGSAPSDPVELVGDLTFSTGVPLVDLAEPLSSVGITIDPAETLRLEGSLDVTLSGFATLGLDAFEITAEVPAATVVPPGLPDWIGGSGAPVEWSTQPWEAFLRFAEHDPATDDDDTLALGASLDGITTTLLGDPPVSFGVEVAFEGTPATGDWTARLTGTMGPWSQPFGIDWLTVDGATLVIEAESVAGQVTPSTTLVGEFDLAGFGVGIEVDLEGVDPFTAAVTLRLRDEITVAHVADALFGGIDAPDAIMTAGVGPGALTVRVTGEGEFSLGGTLRAGFAPFGSRIGVCAMVHADFPAEGPRVALGVSPEPLALSDLLPDEIDGEPLELPVDFDLVTEAPSCGDDTSGPDDSGFAFVYSTFPSLDPDDPALSEEVREWFAPLFGGAPGPLDRVSQDLGVLGSFAVPEPLAAMLTGLGVEPNVLLSGTIPLPTPDPAGGFDFEVGGVDMTLGLRLRDGLLPDFIDGVDLNLRAGITLPSTDSADAPSLSVGLEGAMYLKFKQGVEPALAESLAGIGLELPVSEAGDLTDPCPRGGFRLPGYAVIETAPDTYDEEEGNYCYDKLAVTIGGELEITPPARIQATLFADLTSVNDPDGDDWGWAPLGFDEVLIRQLTGQLTLALEPSPAPFTLEVKLGVGGNFQLLGKDVSGAVQAGVKIDPTVVPPKPPTFVPIFDGLRISLPDGFGTADLLDTYGALEDALRAAASTPADQPSPLDDVDALVAAVPDIEVRNLYFSIAPFGVTELCIDQGLILRGDLYIDPDPASNPLPEGACNRNSGEIEDVVPEPPATPPPSGLCVDRQDEGCFAGVAFSLTPAGIIAEGSMAGFEVGPIEWLESAAELRFTLADQYIKLRGGAYVDLGDGTRPGGEMTLQILPTSIRYSGQLDDIFGFDAVVEGSAEVDPSALFTGGDLGGLRLRAVLASDQVAVGPGPDGVADDYAAQLEADVAAVLAGVQQALADIEAFLDALRSDPIGTLTNLSAELTALGVENGTIPDWVPGFVEDTGEWLALATDSDSDLTLDDILQGPSLPGIPGFTFPAERTCAANDPFGNPLLTIEIDWDTLEVTLELVEGTVVDGVCWTIAPSALTFGQGFEGSWVNPRCVGIETGGGCWLVEPVSLPGVGLCDILSLTPCTVDALWAAHFVPLLGDVLDDAVVAFGEVTDTGALLADLDSVFDGGATGALFELRCAEFEAAIADLEGSGVSLGVEVGLASAPYGLGVTWDFSDFDGSVDALIGLLFAEFEPFSCSGPSAWAVEDLADGGAGGTGGEGPPPPANLSIGVSSRAIFEGQAATVTGTFDRALVEPTDVTIAWGDDSSQVVTVAAGATTLPAVQHTYRDDDPTGTSVDIVTIGATVDNGGAGSTQRLTVRNVAPGDVTVDASPEVLDEHGVVTLSVSFTDPGADDAHVIGVDWGDGTVRTYLPGDPITHRYLDDDPAGTPHDEYAVRVAVRDDDGGTGHGTTVVSVSNVAPSGVAVTWPDTIEEGEWVPYTVTFDDPGTLDLHRVEIDWDGGEIFEADVSRRVRRGARSFTIHHGFTDDHPDTGTASDVLTPTVRVVDDDSGSSAIKGVDVEVFNVAPSIPADGLVLLDPVCGLTDPTAACEVTAVDEDGVVTLAGGFVDPGLDDTHVVSVDWGDGSAVENLVVPAGARSFSAQHRYLDDDPSGTSEDDYTIVATIVDDDTGSGGGEIDLAVRNVDPSVSVDSDHAGGIAIGTDPSVAVTVQYSDPIAAGDGIVVTATDVAGDPLTASIVALDGDDDSRALALLLSVSDADCTVDGGANTNSCSWVVSSEQGAAGIYTDLPPGTYAMQVVVADDDLGETAVDVTVTVEPEDARVWYTGPLFAATESARDGIATVELRATIRDITTTDPTDPAWDPWHGDIRNATLSFVDRDDDAPLCVPPEVPVDEVFTPFDVFDAERSIGVATCDWASDLGNSDSRIWSVGSAAGGYYTRDSSDDDAVVTISRPLDDFITGGGFLVATDSAGVYASRDGSHANFGFHVKFNKKGTNLQGGVNLIVRSEGRVYQIKSNAIDSLGVHDDGVDPAAAEFESKANITDITDEDAPVSIGGNYVLQMRMTDLSEDHGVDEIGFSLWENRKQGATTTQLLLYSSNWTGNVTRNQVIAGGNVMVHGRAV